MSISDTPPQIDTKKRNKSRLAMIAVLILFAFPIVGPFFWTPKSFVNHGDLIQPQARSLETLKLINESGQIVDFDVFQGKWTMLITDQVGCDTRCQTNLYNIRQVRLTQGRRMTRVQLAWILLNGSPSDIEVQIRQDYPLIEIYNIPAQSQIEFNELFSTEFGKPEDGIQRVYFIDPHGNLMMSFDPEQNPKDIQKDLGRLLRVSKAGEEQG